MSTGLWLARFLFGLEVNMSMMWGTMLGQPPDWGTWVLGFMVHLTLAALVAVVYAWVFEYLVHRAGWRVGLSVGLVHTVAAGLLMGLVPLVHPMMPGRMPAPGVFLASRGIGAVAVFVVLHLVYGATVGGLYRVSLAHVGAEA